MRITSSALSGLLILATTAALPRHPCDKASSSDRAEVSPSPGNQ